MRPASRGVAPNARVGSDAARASRADRPRSLPLTAHPTPLALLLTLATAALAAPAPEPAPTTPALAPVVAPAAATDTREEAARDALDNWDWALREQGLVLQHRTLRDLGAHDHPSVVAALLEYLPESEAALRPTLRRLLGSFAAPDSLVALRDDGLGHRHAMVREHVALALGEGLPADADEGASWGDALLPLLDDRHGEVRAAAVFALGRLRHAEAQAALLDATTDPSAAVRRQAAEALVRVVGNRAVNAIVPLLGDANWRVRSATARALGNVRTQAAAKALIARLELEQGRVREELLGSLSRLSGQNLGLNLDAWQRWLDLSGKELVATLPRESEREPGSTPSVARYYGVPTLSTRFVIITDLSGSMANVDPGGYRNLEGRGRSKLELTKDELTGLVRGLPSDVLFNLVTFADGVHSWQRQLVEASERNRARAQTEVDSWRAEGGTNLFAAIETTLDLAEEEWRGDRKAQGRAPDTVYLLTDGEPSAGAIDDMPLLLEYVKERNRELDVRFHCIALTSVRHPRDFLVGLARANGGTALTPLD